MNSLLGHSTVTTKTCIECGWQTVRKTLHEQDRILHVGWDQETSLEQILRDRNFNDDVHYDLNCCRCMEKRQHPYSKRLWTVPDVFIIHFMRFRPNSKATAYQKKKVRKPWQFWQFTRPLNGIIFTYRASVLTNAFIVGQH